MSAQGPQGQPSSAHHDGGDPQPAPTPPAQGHHKAGDSLGSWGTAAGGKGQVTSPRTPDLFVLFLNNQLWYKVQNLPPPLTTSPSKGGGGEGVGRRAAKLQNPGSRPRIRA